MDTHFAYSTYTMPGLMDQIFSNLNRYNLKFKVGKQKARHASDHTKQQLDLVGYSGEYTNGLWVIEPTGTTLKIGGVLSDSKVAYFASIPDTNWCPVECNFGLQPGKVDPSHIFTDDLRFSQHDDELNQFYAKFVTATTGHHQFKYYFVVGITFFVLMAYGVMRCCVKDK